ncbi:PKD domain-containing protein [Halorientalis sp.]|uniref:PKD domain-containing protein n=1 Tax=Halorientalis sp. TaxID=1931229 RepID=UPI002626F5D7|nr:PKD domain-containing protein [Halorientalis sp.]
MYNRKRIARGAGTAIATWALIGLLVMSTGVAYALPLAGVGGFNVTASEITADDLVLYPGVGNTDSEDNFPQTVVQLSNTDIQQFALTKDLDLGSVPMFPLPGTLRIKFLSPGGTDGGNVLVKSTALGADQATFNGFLTNDTNASDARGRWSIRSDGPVTLQGTDRSGVRIRAHYLATDRISITNLRFFACYDADDDGTFEWGPCSADTSSGGGSGNAAPTADADANSTTVGVGDTVSFNGSGSNDSDGSIVAYEWSFGDGTSATGQQAEHVYDEPGAYTARLTVTDDDGATTIEPVTVVVESNEPPMPSPTASSTTVESGQPITFDGSGSSDLDGSITLYQWDFGDGTTAAGQQVTHTYTESGSYAATLTVTDDDGATASSSVSITVQNSSTPDSLVANASGSPSQVTVGESVTLDGSGSSGTNSTITSYEWDFTSDGTVDATGQQVTTAYSSGGEKTATLTVTDDDGDTATDTVTTAVTVDTNDAPTANVSANPTTVDVNEVVAFDGAGSNDSDGSIVDYEWDFDSDGTAEVTGQPRATYAYSSPGSYVATLTVTDDDGATASTDITVTVGANDAPTASASANATTVEVGEPVSLDGSGSGDPDGSVVAYEWDVDGDGTDDATGQQVDTSFASAGEKTVTLTVTDNDGATATTTVTVTVDTNDAPTASASANATTVEVGEPVSLDGSTSGDSDGSITTYEWDVDGDGTVDATGQRVDTNFASAGEKTVTLTVTDDDGATASTNVSLTVDTNDAPTASASASPDPVDPDETVSLDGSASSDPDGSITTYEWDVDGDGTVDATGQQVDTSFSSSGDKMVTLTVTDDDGATASTDVTVTVNECFFGFCF